MRRPTGRADLPDSTVLHTVVIFVLKVVSCKIVSKDAENFKNYEVINADKGRKLYLVLNMLHTKKISSRSPESTIYNSIKNYFSIK